MNVIGAKKIAYFLLKLAEQNDIPLSNMELQKLLYFAQGKFLAKYGKPLFEEDMQAWKYGPVVPEAYQEFRRFGSSPIFLQEQNIGLSDDLSQHLGEILSEYSHLDGIQLSKMTHSERPWIQARGTLKEDEDSQRIIKKEWIKYFFSKTEEEKKAYSEQINIMRKIAETDRDVLIALAK